MLDTAMVDLSHTYFLEQLMPRFADRPASELEELSQRLLSPIKALWRKSARPAGNYGLSLAEIADFLVERLPHCNLETAELAPTLETLVLALACCKGNSRAIAEFERLYFVSVEPALRCMKLDATAIGEVLQIIREKLFVGKATGERPRVAELVGNGDLRALIRIIAMRVALNLRRKDKRLVSNSDEQMIHILAPDSSPELATIKKGYRSDVKQAFEGALADLTAQDRTVLRLHLVHGLSIDEIGTTYRVHRATAARWLTKVRSQLEQSTRSDLQTRLGVDCSEFQSMIRMVQSRLDISFDRLLATVDELPTIN